MVNANKSSEKMRHTKAASASAGNSSRIAYRVYQDPAVYAAELENVFYGPTWNYVGLSAEIPNNQGIEYGKLQGSYHKITSNYRTSNKKISETLRRRTMA